MAELDKSQDFGIENTMSVDTAGVGDQGLLDDLFSPETSTADPNKISSLEDNGDDDKKKETVDDKKDKTTDGKEIPKEKVTDPTALTNFLIGEEEAEEEEEEISDDKKTETPTGEEAGEEGGEGEGEEGDDGAQPGIIAFDSLANELADLGVFSRLEGEEEGIGVENAEDFLERFKMEQQRGANEMISNFIGQFGQEYQEAFQAIYVNGTNPRQYFNQAAKIEDFSNMDLSIERNQEQVVRQVLLGQGFESEDIQKEIDKLKNYGDLEDVSKRHHKVLLKQEQQALKQKEEQAQLEQQNKLAMKQAYVDNVNNVLTEKLKTKEFDGIPLNAQVVNELQDFLLVDKWKTESGETLTDFDKAILDLKKPENHENKVKLGLLLKLLEKDPTLSTIQKRAVSKKSSQLFKDVARQKTTAKRAVANKKQPAVTSWFQK